MKIQVGTILVLVATASMFFRGPGSHDPVQDTFNEILAVITGLAAYAVVLLGVIDSPPKQRWAAAVIAAVLLLPTLGFCALGARFVSLAWTRRGDDYWLGVLGIVSTFAVASVVYAIGSWIQRRRR
jgi:hypothetical protein